MWLVKVANRPDIFPRNLQSEEDTNLRRELRSADLWGKTCLGKIHDRVKREGWHDALNPLSCGREEARLYPR